jgi:hypothetical protein
MARRGAYESSIGLGQQSQIGSGAGATGYGVSPGATGGDVGMGLTP